MTLKQARFSDQMRLLLLDSGYPPLDYELVEEEIEGSEVGRRRLSLLVTFIECLFSFH